jgi:hypothetical protein
MRLPALWPAGLACWSGLLIWPAGLACRSGLLVWPCCPGLAIPALGPPSAPPACPARRYTAHLGQEQARGLDYPDEPVSQWRATHAPDSSTRKPRSNDLTTLVEAQLGKPTHLLEEDKLAQFLQVRLTGWGGGPSWALTGWSGCLLARHDSSPAWARTWPRRFRS